MMTMKISLIAAVSDNGIIGSGLDIPWQVKGEQLLFKGLTYNQWLLVGRKTFDSMGKLSNRKYAVVSRSVMQSVDGELLFFTSINDALESLKSRTEHVFVSGGGQIYKAMLPVATTVHLSRVHVQIDGDICFPQLPADFSKVFEQEFESNLNYTYQIWKRN